MNLTDKITEHFTYGEVIKSYTADKMGLDNSLPEGYLPKIKLIAENILEKVRANFGRPIEITSWYRCPALNQMVSNNPNSQHTKGEAVDFTIPGLSNLIVAEYIRDNLEYDQLIMENQWIHVSLIDSGNRKSTLHTNDRKTYKEGLC